MQTFKRTMALLLVLVMAFSMIPVQSFAAEPQTAPEVDTGDMTIEGTNGFGNLLSEAITEEQEATAEAESEYEAGYTVTDLEIVDNVATVTYDSMEEAILIVALYTEDGMQLVTSAKTTVTSDETEATVTFGDDMPQYFLASAYLVDTYDLSPLCAAYDTPMYTQEMQELLASTVNDYDPELVLNLDEDETTNFAVYAETTKIIEPVEGYNTVVSVDDETATYVIENADEQFTTLAVGDVVAYSYGENDILIVKVAAITVDGTTVTITGAELDLEEVFSVMKLENTGSAEDMIVDENSGDEGITYTGTNPEETVTPNAWGDNAEQEFSMGFNIEKQINDYSSVSGSIGIKFKIEFEYYISWSRQFMRFEKSATVEINVGYEFKADAPIPKATSKLKLKSFGFSPIASVYIGFEPEVVVEFTATVQFECTLKTSGGFTFEAGKGGRDLTKKPTVTIDIKIEGSIFFGIDFGPYISIMGDKVAKAKLSSQVGFELTGKAAGYLFEDITVQGDNPDVTHECDLCYQMELAAKAEFSLKIELLKTDWLTFEMKIAAKKYKIGLMYYSVAFSDFGFGDCPHKEYRLTVNVLDENSEPCSGAVIKVGEYSDQTNENGVVAFYLPKKKYIITCDWGDSSTHKSITLDDAKKIKFVKGEPPAPENSFEDDWNFGTVDDTGFLAHGQCGDNAVWKLDGTGCLVISGTGDVTRYPWSDYKAYINKVEIRNGITSICADAFSGCTAMQSLTIGDSVVTLGLNAFNGCTGLVEVTMPCDVTVTVKTGYGSNVYQSSFTGCTNVRVIHYTVGRTGIMPNRTDRSYDYADSYQFALEWKCRGSLQTVIFDEGVTHIADYAFYNCTSLTEAEIPSTVDSFGHYAFSGCSALKDISWPENIVFLGDGAFRSCATFTEIDLPSTLTMIRANAFSGCTGLTSLEIPDSITTLGLNAFNGCTGLVEVTMPCDVTVTAETGYSSNVYQSSFTGCTNVRVIHYTFGRSGIMPNRTDRSYDYADSYQFTLEWKSRACLQTVIFDEGITHIADYAFYNCSMLSDAVIPSTVDSFGHYSFSGCKALQNISWPESIIFLGNGAFQNCETFTQIDIPATITTISTNAFSGCIGLTALIIPDSVTTLGLNAFNGCTGLKEVTLPCDVSMTVETGYSSNLYQSSFTGCVNVRTIHYTVGRTGMMPNRTDRSYAYADSYQFTLEWKSKDRLGTITFEEGITQIGGYAFYKATRLKSVTLPSTLDTVCDYSFSGCTALTQLAFLGDVPIIDNNAFQGDVLTCYYPADNDTWTASDMVNYGGTITWMPYTLDENGDMIVNGAVVTMAEPDEVEEELLTAMTAASAEETDDPVQMMSQVQLPTTDFGEKDENLAPDAVYEGEYGTEITDTYIFKTASFAGLVPGEQYVLIALKSIEAEDPLASDNLLFVDQAAALEDGTLMFTYIQRENTAISYVVACGASNKNLKDANITFPTMKADGTLQVVEPTVVYSGETLTEGTDYTIVGSVSFTQDGTYTCYVRGIHNYTGLVECTYTVTSDVESVATGWSGATTWVLTSDGVLTFSGEGNMKNYGYAGGQPWLDYADQITSVVIEEGVTAVGSGAFKGLTRLEAVTLPENGLTKIGEAAFYGCTSLKAIDIPDTVYTVFDYTFKNCTALEEVRFSKILIKIGQGAFENCTALTYVYIPGNTGIIGSWSFKGCTGLTEVDMTWADATEIREGAFKNCSALTTIHLPGNIQTLGDSCFYGIGATAFTIPETVTTVEAWCFARAKLTQITFEGDAPAIGEGAFNKITLTAYYPDRNTTWTSDIMQNYGGTITWTAQ